MREVDVYHQLAKDAGNRLRSYILSVSSGACGVFFFSLTNSTSSQYSSMERVTLVVALVAFLSTAGLCLWELRVDAKRFFALAKEIEKPEKEQNWCENEKYKKRRYWLIHISYVTLTIGMIFTGIFLITQIIHL